MPQGKRCTNEQSLRLNDLWLEPILSPQLSPENKGTIIVGMCDGLLHLHAKDIVHQDLKPENIMVSGGGDEYYINIF